MAWVARGWDRPQVTGSGAGTTGDAQFSAFIEQGLRSSFDFNRKGVTADYAKRFTGFQRPPKSGADLVAQPATINAATAAMDIFAINA